MGTEEEWMEKIIHYGSNPKWMRKYLTRAEELRNTIASMIAIDEALVADFSDTLDSIMVKIDAYTKKAVLEANKLAWEKLNTWLIEHDQAKLDSSRISIKASEWLKEYADRLQQLTPSSISRKGENDE